MLKKILLSCIILTQCIIQVRAGHVQDTAYRFTRQAQFCLGAGLALSGGLAAFDTTTQPLSPREKISSSIYALATSILGSSIVFNHVITSETRKKYPNQGQNVLGTAKIVCANTIFYAQVISLGIGSLAVAGILEQKQVTQESTVPLLCSLAVATVCSKLNNLLLS